MLQLLKYYNIETAVDEPSYSTYLKNCGSITLKLWTWSCELLKKLCGIVEMQLYLWRLTEIRPWYWAIASGDPPRNWKWSPLYGEGRDRTRDCSITVRCCTIIEPPGVQHGAELPPKFMFISKMYRYVPNIKYSWKKLQQNKKDIKANFVIFYYTVWSMVFSQTK